MREILLVLYIITQVFWYLLLARIVVEMIASFSRGWSPRGVLAVVLEWLFTITDPPVKALRKVIKPVRLGQVSLDLSVLVLFVIIIVIQLVLRIMITSVA
ncbi:membrane protein [Dietzia sp. UCD-THP]|uniref:YggT family protein n=1 Tax=Dietzia natronolimnaea TaxID=161920 RepID=A0A2A2WTG7_9ACTN|nr:MULTISPECIES: YggT family protein [Dietzia]EYT64355.1 membrane protein [Dietzia sp. UCD-THP]PAY24333.1 YggT family protein [Dietzia natronolimnaea]